MSTVTLEKTSKRLKLRLLLSVFLLVFGVLIGLPVALCLGDYGQHPVATAVSLSPLVIGPILWVVTKIQIWWEHG